MGRLQKLRPALASLPPALPRPAAEAETRVKTQPGVELYHTKRWRDLVLKIRKRDRYTCRKTGVLLVGKRPAPNSPIVDHIVPHRGDEALFFDEDNLQLVSKAWHDSVKQSQEKRGRGRA